MDEGLNDGFGKMEGGEVVVLWYEKLFKTAWMSL